MEGKEVRFGIANTALFATVTTDASCGAINGWHDSFTPLGGLVPLANMQLSEVVFGGVGAGHVRRARLHHPVGVHRRPDGRPDARVSRQEDSGVRSADGDADRPDLLAADPDVHGDLVGVARASARRASSIPARTGCPRCSTPTRRRRPTTARRSAASASTPTGTTPRSA